MNQLLHRLIASTLPRLCASRENGGPSSAWEFLRCGITKPRAILFGNGSQRGVTDITSALSPIRELASACPSEPRQSAAVNFTAGGSQFSKVREVGQADASSRIGLSAEVFPRLTHRLIAST